MFPSHVEIAIGSECRSALSANLRMWRKRRGVPLKQAAGELGVAVSTWSQWEGSKRFPSDRMLILIAMYLQIPVCRLIRHPGSPCEGQGGHFTDREIWPLVPSPAKHKSRGGSWSAADV